MIEARKREAGPTVGEEQKAADSVEPLKPAVPKGRLSLDSSVM